MKTNIIVLSVTCCSLSVVMFFSAYKHQKREAGFIGIISTKDSIINAYSVAMENGNKALHEAVVRETKMQEAADELMRTMRQHLVLCGESRRLNQLLRDH